MTVVVCEDVTCKYYGTKSGCCTKIRINLKRRCPDIGGFDCADYEHIKKNEESLNTNPDLVGRETWCFENRKKEKNDNG